MFILLSCLFAVFSGGCRTIDPEIMREEERLLQAVRINPAHEMGYLRYAQFLERQGRFRETLMVLRKGRQRVPDSILMIRLEGSLIQHLQSRESALEFYDAQLTRRPDQPNLLLDRAHLLLRMERTEPALAEVKKALGLDPDLFEAHYLAGIIHSRRKEHEKAVDAFISASRIQEDHPELWSRIAAMWEKLGEPRKARAAIRKALDHDPESFLFLQQYATLLESALDEDDPETIAELRAAIRQLLWLGPEDSWVLAHAGFLAWHDGDFEEAETLLKQALAVQSPYPWASFRLGTVYMSRKQWRRALLSFQEGLEGQPESPWAFRQIGLAYEMLGDAAKAIEHYELVLDRDSKNLPLLIRLTNLYWDEFRFSDVERVLNKGLSEFPRNLELLNLLLKYHQSRGQFEPAVALLRSSAKIHPDNMMVLSRLGEFELQLGHYQSAREWFRRALKNKPRHPMLWMQLIQIDLLEKQDYPDRRRTPDGPPDPPYDLAGWTLPMQMGVNVVRLDESFGASTQPLNTYPQVEPGEVSGNARFGYALSPRRNASIQAVNRLTRAGEQVSRSTTAFDAGRNEYPAGSYIIENRGPDSVTRINELANELGLDFQGLRNIPDTELEQLSAKRIGLYKSWVANMDEGWTRWLLENYEFDLENLSDQDVRDSDLSRFDAILLPSQGADSLLNGHTPGTMPEEYVGGLGLAGALALKEYVEAGGTLVTLDAASDFAIQQFGIPVENTVAGTTDRQFFIPGSLIRAKVDTEHSLTAGMQEEIATSFVNSRAFEVVTLPRTMEGGEVQTMEPPEQPVETIVSYAEEDLLMSGWALGEEDYIAEKAAMMRVALGEGNVILFGFRPQFRGQPRATYKLLFNSLLH